MNIKKFNYMKKTLLFIAILSLVQLTTFAQDYGDFPKIEKQKLLNDLELLYQGLDKFHSGMYWYTSKKTVDSTFAKVKNEINRDMNVLEFHKLIAALVSLSREGHTSLSLSDSIKKKVIAEVTFLPLTVKFLGGKIYCYSNGSAYNDSLKGLEIESINGVKPLEIAEKLGSFYPSDGYIKSVKKYYLGHFNLSKSYFYYYGETNNFSIKFKNKKAPIILEALTIKEINKNILKRKTRKKTSEKKELLEYKILNDSTAYLGIHSFSNDDLIEMYGDLTLKIFLENSFESIAEKNIQNLIIDVSKNSGGTEGNGSMLYSYLGENFKKYNQVRVNTNKGSLDNGVDKPIILKVFRPLEKVFYNKKMGNGSYERRQWPGNGLMAYKKEPKNKFKGKNLYYGWTKNVFWRK